MTIKSNKRALFVLCWLAYMATYICRLNFSAVMPSMIADAIFSKAQIANISSCLFITYGIGQFANGFLGDKLNPKYMLFIGVCASGLCNLIMFFTQNYAAMLVLWGINGFAQSMVWAPIVRIMGQYYEGKERESFGANFTSAVPLGTLASYAVSLFVLMFLPWKYVFLVSGAMVIAISVVWLFLSAEPLKRLPKVVFNKVATSDHANKISTKKFLTILCVSGIAMAFIPSAIQGILKDGVTNWVPTFIFENFDASTSLSLAPTMLLPIINVTGAYLAVWINKKIKNEIFTSIVFFVVASSALVVLLFAGKYSIVLTIICLAIITNSMFAVNTMIITFMPLNFAKYNKASTVSGVLNSVAYLGVGISNFATGAMLTKYSWNAVIIMWATMSVSAVLLCVLIGFMWRKYLKKTIPNL